LIDDKGAHPQKLFGVNAGKGLAITFLNCDFEIFRDIYSFKNDSMIHLF
jgi:hypothetical protein